MGGFSIPRGLHVSPNLQVCTSLYIITTTHPRHDGSSHIICQAYMSQGAVYTNIWWISVLAFPFDFNSPMSDLNMHSSKKEKIYANSRARRHSNDSVASKSKKKKKDTDTESVTSSTSSDSTLAAEKKCPFRFMLAGMMEGQVEGERGCPLRRVQLWHTIPLCLLAIINLLLVIVALLGLAGYRITKALQTLLLRFNDLQFATSEAPEPNEVPAIIVEKMWWMYKRIWHLFVIYNFPRFKNVFGISTYRLLKNSATFFPRKS